MTATLTIEIKKTKDGRPSLACVRADGSRTWATVHPFFPTHDLTHCAVESALGFDEAFFGLISRGWRIDDFAEKGSVSRLPAQAICAERIVGHIESRTALDASELNAALALDAQKDGAPPCTVVSEDQFAALFTLRAGFMRRWHELPEGDTLRIGFPAASA